MKITVLAGVAVGTLLLLTAPLCAQIYKYTDQNGQPRWTDDMSQVPVDQRESAERMEGALIPSRKVLGRQADTEAAAAPEADPPESAAGLTRESLMAEKADLEDQYQRLLDERKQLEQMISQKGDAARRSELEQRVSAYNARSKQYETRLNAYKQRIDAYKKKIMSTDDPPTP